MAPTTQKRKATAVATDKSKPAASRKPAAKKPRKGKAKQQADDDATDEGRRGSKHFFDLAKSKKRKISANIGKREIWQQADELVSFIDEKQKEKLPSSNFATDIRKAIAPKGITLFAYLNKSKKSSALGDLRNITETAVSDALVRFKEMAKDYEAVNMLPENLAHRIQKPTWMKWSTDKKDLDTLNQHAMTAAARIVSSYIIPNPKPSLATVSEKAADIEKLAWEMLEDVGPKHGDETWGKIAQGQCKVFAGILREMPEEQQDQYS